MPRSTFLFATLGTELDAFCKKSISCIDRLDFGKTSIAKVDFEITRMPAFEAETIGEVVWFLYTSDISR